MWLWTSCGRRVTVGRLLTAGPRSIRRVTLRIGCQPLERTGTGDMWTALTAAEARVLAEYLWAEANELDAAAPGDVAVR